MSTIKFECEVTEYNSIADAENNKNTFVICDQSVIINLMDHDTILNETEIDKKDAIELAKLILLKYDM
jgi:hypothetical protein